MNYCTIMRQITGFCKTNKMQKVEIFCSDQLNLCELIIYLYRLELLKALSDNGKDISYFEEMTGKKLIIISYDTVIMIIISNRYFKEQNILKTVSAEHSSKKRKNQVTTNKPTLWHPF